MSDDTNNSADEEPLIRVGQTVYKVLQYSRMDSDPRIIEQDLIAWGLKGWELVSVTEVPLQHDYWQHGITGVRNYNFQTTIYLKYTFDQGIPVLNMQNYKWFLEYAEKCMNKIEDWQRETTNKSNE